MQIENAPIKILVLYLCTFTKFVLKYFPAAKPKSFKTPSLKLVKTPLPHFERPKTLNSSPACAWVPETCCCIWLAVKASINVCAYECVVCARTPLLLFLLACWLCCMQIQQRQIERPGAAGAPAAFGFVLVCAYFLTNTQVGGRLAAHNGNASASSRACEQMDGS
jgi:hypothetical protein